MSDNNRLMVNRRQRQTLENWICVQLFGDTDGKCTRFELRHLAMGQKKGKIVCSIKVPLEYDEGHSDEILRELEAMSEADATGMGGTQVYVALAFFGGRKTEGARYPFRATNADDDEILSEPPTGTGMIAQAQRHLESVMRINTLGQSQVISVLTRMVERLDVENSNLQKGRIETVEIFEELMSKRHDREMDMLREERRGRLLDTMADKVETLMPVIANKLSGQRLLPEPDHGREMVKTFIGSLEKDQLEQMSGILRPEQAVLFATAAEQFMKEKEAEEKALKTLHNKGNDDEQAKH